MKKNKKIKKIIGENFNIKVRKNNEKEWKKYETKIYDDEDL